jgi:hypothetical protein
MAPRQVEIEPDDERELDRRDRVGGSPKDRLADVPNNVPVEVPEEVVGTPEAPPAAAAPPMESITRVRERIERDAQRQIQFEKRELLRGFLEVLDDLDRAYEAAQKGDEAIRAGVGLVRERFLGKLREHGVSRVPTAGERFDPNQHEALVATRVTDPADDGRVLRELRPGYHIDGEVLRPAAVEVGRA